jgi:hypothetical protein
VRVRGVTHRRGFRSAATRSDVELLKDGAAIEKEWIVIPLRGCTLVDTPKLVCRP